MLWPTARLRRLDPEVTKRLALARQNSPESETWLTLVEAALAESADVSRWRAAIPAPVEGRPARAPLLHGAEIAVDGRAVRRFVRRLAGIAALNGGAPDRLDAVGLVEAEHARWGGLSIEHDRQRQPLLLAAGEVSRMTIRELPRGQPHS